MAGQVPLQRLVWLAVNHAENMFGRRQAFAYRYGWSISRHCRLFRLCGQIISQGKAGGPDEVGKTFARDIIVRDKGTHQLNSERRDVRLVVFRHWPRFPSLSNRSGLLRGFA